MTTRGVGGGRWFGEVVFDAIRNVPHLRRWSCGFSTPSAYALG